MKKASVIVLSSTLNLTDDANETEVKTLSNVSSARQ